MKASRGLALALAVGFLLSAMASCSTGDVKGETVTAPEVEKDKTYVGWKDFEEGSPRTMCDASDSTCTPEAGATSLVIIVDPKAGE